jgi:nicotinate-nucleotide pyrophosphorylase (carboxylating)
MRLPALVAAALAEDLGKRGDITSQLMIPDDTFAIAEVVARSPGVFAGRDAGAEVINQAQLAAEWLCKDGAKLAAGQTVVRVTGSARTILAAERTLLNFLSHLSGIATMTAEYVAACRPALVLDTRKTTPGWRQLEKAAVVAGGGTNHRMGLFDRVLVKDNHLALAGESLANVVRLARKRLPGVIVQVEADDLQGVERALACEVDWILLDNMDVATMRHAVRVNRGRTKLEASGRMDLERAAAAAACGVDAISVGALTHSAHVLDLGLDMRAG